MFSWGFSHGLVRPVCGIEQRVLDVSGRSVGTDTVGSGRGGKLSWVGESPISTGASGYDTGANDLFGSSDRD